MSASLPEGVFPLLTADDDAACSYGGFVAVCGEVMTRSGLPPSCYPPGESAGRDPRYCPACVRGAARWSAEAGDRSAAPLPMAPDASAQAAQDDDSEPRGYFVGKCGHRVPLIGEGWHIGPCDDCDPRAT